MNRARIRELDVLLEALEQLLAVDVVTLPPRLVARLEAHDVGVPASGRVVDAHRAVLREQGRAGLSRVREPELEDLTPKCTCRPGEPLCRHCRGRASQAAQHARRAV